MDSYPIQWMHYLMTLKSGLSVLVDPNGYHPKVLNPDEKSLRNLTSMEQKEVQGSLLSRLKRV